MPIRTSYPAGMPCWIDCITCDLAATMDFYRGLFGWTFDSEGAGYHLVRRDHQIIGGLGVAPAGRAHESFWTTYLASKNLDATVAAVREYGGQVVMPPMAAGGNGRLFLALDPAGAAVGFWQGERDEGVVLTDEPGAMVGHELRTGSAAVLSFYRRLFPVTASPMDASTVEVTLDGVRGFTVHETTEAPRWVICFGADTVVDVAARAVSLGATLIDGADAGGDPAGTLTLSDPAGAVFALRAAG